MGFDSLDLDKLGFQIAKIVSFSLCCSVGRHFSCYNGPISSGYGVMDDYRWQLLRVVRFSKSGFIRYPIASFFVVFRFGSESALRVSILGIQQSEWLLGNHFTSSILFPTSLCGT